MMAGRAYAQARDERLTLMIGVVAEHDSEMAEQILDDLTAFLASHPAMPLLFHTIRDDCLVAPPERKSLHIEVRWLQL